MTHRARYTGDAKRKTTRKSLAVASEKSERHFHGHLTRMRQRRSTPGRLAGVTLPAENDASTNPIEGRMFGAQSGVLKAQNPANLVPKLRLTRFVFVPHKGSHVFGLHGAFLGSYPDWAKIGA
jgi:hypothetical protein